MDEQDFSGSDTSDDDYEKVVIRQPDTGQAKGAYRPPQKKAACAARYAFENQMVYMVWSELRKRPEYRFYKAGKLVEVWPAELPTKGRK